MFLFIGKPQMSETAPKVRPVQIDNVQLVKTASLSKNDFSLGKFSFYPNPAKDVINLSSVKKIDKVEFVNILGQKALYTYVNALNKQVDVSNLQRGVYLMNVTIDGAVGTYKIIKN